jgi:hypothetical protein
LVNTGANLGQKTFSAISFIKAIERQRQCGKASHYFEKASIPPKLYLKGLAILERASNFSEKFFKNN